MFNLELAIAEWRQRMLAAGIKSPVPLEELDNHLREDVEAKMRSGWGVSEAFAAAVEEIGPTGDLKSEFARAGGPVYERWKQAMRTLAGLPDYQLATNMNVNTPLPASEPRWATYVKTLGWVFPATLVWMASNVFVLPKLREICSVANTVGPKPILFILALSDLLKYHLPLVLVVAGLVLTALEWRARGWARRRRLVLGATAFFLNSFVLMLILAMLILAVLASIHLMDRTR